MAEVREVRVSRSDRSDRSDRSEQVESEVNSKETREVLKHLKRVYKYICDLGIPCTRIDDLIVRDQEEYIMIMTFRERRLHKMRRAAREMFASAADECDDNVPAIARQPAKTA